MLRSVPKITSAFLIMLPAISIAEQRTEYPGRVEALNRVEVSAQVDGIVRAIRFQPGQLVSEGDLLFVLDTVDFVQRLRAAEAVEKKAIALLDDAQQELGRNETLKERGAISDARYFKSKAAVAIASAVLAEATSKREIAQIMLGRTSVHAPISGIISPSRVSRGSFAETGRKNFLATIVQLDPVRIAYEIPYPDRLFELGITDLNTIETYSGSVDLAIELAPGHRHPELAEPTNLSADVNPETRSIKAWAIARNPTHILRPGMEVKVIPLTQEGATFTNSTSD